MEGFNTFNTIEQPPQDELENTQEKINKENEKLIAESLKRLASEIQQLEETLRLNNFGSRSFNVDDFNGSIDRG